MPYFAVIGVILVDIIAKKAKITDFSVVFVVMIKFISKLSKITVFSVVIIVTVDRIDIRKLVNPVRIFQLPGLS